MSVNSKNEQLKKAFDSATLNWKLIHLSEEQATEFLDMVRDESNFLKNVRFVKMTKSTKTISKLLSKKRFLNPWTIWVKLDESKYDVYGSETIELSTNLVRGAIMVTDEELADNPEWKSLESHIMTIIAKKVANESEEMALYGEAQSDPNDILEYVDWIIKQIKDKWIVLDAKTFTDRYISKGKMKKMLKSIPTKFRTGVKYYMPSDLVLDYVEQYDTVADSGVKGELTRRINWKDYVNCPLMSVERPVLTNTSTTLSAWVTKWSTTVPFTLATSFSQWDSFKLWKDIYEIKSISTNTIELDHVAERNYDSWAIVTKVTLDWADVVLADPLSIAVGFQTSDMELETERIASVWYIFHYKARNDCKVIWPEWSAVFENLLSKEE